MTRITSFPRRTTTLALLTVVLLLSAIPALAANQYKQGLLWEIIPASGEPSYLFGTIHSEDPRVTRLPAPVQKKFDQAAIFCAEMKMDVGTQTRMSLGMMYLDEQRLDQKVDEQLYRKTVSLVSGYNIPEQIAPKLKPWAAGLVLSVPRPETGMFLDYMLYRNAGKQGKEQCGLETPAEVIALFDDTPMKTQVNLLKMAVREYDNLDKMFEEMMQYYLARDLDGLLAYSNRELKKSGRDVSALVNDKLVATRNRNMLANMQMQIKKGNAFFAVGALHLPGENGLLKMLADKGYRLKAIY